MENLIFECDLKVIGTSGAYPSNNNCFVVEITQKETKQTYINHFFKKCEYNMIIKLKELLKSRTVTKNDIAELVKLIEEYGSEKYSEASDDASMNEAGEDL